MERDFETNYHRLEEQHFWFRARRNTILRLLRMLPPDRDARIADLGCASGRLIAEMRRLGFHKTVGADISPIAIRQCHEAKVDFTVVADAACSAFADSSLDVIVASDILEHIADDQGALNHWRSLLRPGGWAIVFVPAFMNLWSPHDVTNHHFRRYRLGELVRKAESAGLEVQRSGYWNCLLFPLILVIRLLRKRRLSNRSLEARSDLALPSKYMNRVLAFLLSAEGWFIAQGGYLPVGVSAFIVARRTFS